MNAIIVNLIIASVLAGIRIAGHKSEAFQAIAHLYVGGLFAWSVCSYLSVPVRDKLFDVIDIKSIGLFLIAVAISLIELIVALWKRMAG